MKTFDNKNKLLMIINFSSNFQVFYISGIDLLNIKYVNKNRSFHIVLPEQKDKTKFVQCLIVVLFSVKNSNKLKNGNYFCLPRENDFFISTIFTYKSMSCAELEMKME